MARDDDKSVVEEIRQRIGPKPDETNNPPPKKLPKSIQETLDSEEKLWEALYEGHARESTETNWRYAAYATRIRTLLLSAHRYVAYTSDIGESFRPVAHPYLVKGAYGISWAYLAGDVAHEGYKAYLRNQRVLHPDATSPADAISGYGSGHDPAQREKLGNVGAVVGSDKFAAQQPQSVSLGPGNTGASTGQLSAARVPALEDYRTVMVQRALFQGIASMGLPAFTIHSIVKYSGRALKDAKNVKIRTWGPIGLGLAAVPFLPYAFDKPVEEAIEWTFHKAFETFGGKNAVGHRPETGRQELLQLESKAAAAKEKEL